MEAALHGRELTVCAKRLDGVDTLAADCRREREARQCRLVVDQHGAGAAFAAIAAGLCAGEPNLFTQVVEQQNIIADRIGAVTAIEPALQQTGQAFRPPQARMTCAAILLFYNPILPPEAAPPKGFRRPIPGNGWNDYVGPNFAITSAGIALPSNFSGAS